MCEGTSLLAIRRQSVTISQPSFKLAASQPSVPFTSLHGEQGTRPCHVSSPHPPCLRPPTAGVIPPSLPSALPPARACMPGKAPSRTNHLLMHCDRSRFWASPCLPNPHAARWARPPLQQLSSWRQPVRPSPPTPSARACGLPRTPPTRL